MTSIKLSPAQADVIKKMREGAEVVQTGLEKKYYLIPNKTVLNPITAMKLEHFGLMAEYKRKRPGLRFLPLEDIYYRLTDLGRTLPI